MLYKLCFWRERICVFSPIEPENMPTKVQLYYYIYLCYQDKAPSSIYDAIEVLRIVINNIISKMMFNQ